MIEQQLNSNLFTKPAEKTYVDKILARADIERIGVLMRKTNLKREEILELLYLLNSSEIKLVSYDENLRYFLAKFFVWLRDVAQQAELLFYYSDKLSKRPELMSENSKKMIESIRIVLENSFKFLADIYLNVVRSSLSLHGKGYDALLSNRFEMNYGGNVPGVQPIQPLSPKVGR